MGLRKQSCGWGQLHGLDATPRDDVDSLDRNWRSKDGITNEVHDSLWMRYIKFRYERLFFCFFRLLVGISSQCSGRPVLQVGYSNSAHPATPPTQQLRPGF
jgi:hypothetical protein